MKVNENKSFHITFSLKQLPSSQVNINNKTIPQTNSVRYLGLYLDSRLTWNVHIKYKSHEMDIKTKKMYWLIGIMAPTTLENKILIYKTIIRPIWTYRRYRTMGLFMLIKCKYYSEIPIKIPKNNHKCPMVYIKQITP